MPTKFVAEITKRINEIHERKNQDYSQEGNPFSNFERMSTIAEWFNDPVHKSFVSLIGVKLARLAELLNGKVPKNESIDDSFLDLCTYCVLFHAYYLTHQEQIQIDEYKEKLRQHQNSYNQCIAPLPSDKGY